MLEQTINEDQPEHEIRFYLRQIQKLLSVDAHSQDPDSIRSSNNMAPFVPQYLITAVKLPTGAIEIAINTENITEKIDYILAAYNNDMQLLTNQDVVMQNIMVV